MTTLKIPLSCLMAFEVSGYDTKYLRWGQAFHQFLELNKITSEPNKTWCDKLYNADYAAALSMVYLVLDWEN
jgi:hypothetical protein